MGVVAILDMGLDLVYGIGRELTAKQEVNPELFSADLITSDHIPYENLDLELKGGFFWCFSVFSVCWISLPQGTLLGTLLYVLLYIQTLRDILKDFFMLALQIFPLK